MKKETQKLVKVRSIFNGDTYFTSDRFPTKYIDGKEFVGVKKSESDNQILYMMKENLEYIL